MIVTTTSSTETGLSPSVSLTETGIVMSSTETGQSSSSVSSARTRGCGRDWGRDCDPDVVD